MGHHVIIASSAQNLEFKLKCDQLGYETKLFPMNDSSFEEWLSQYPIDFAFFDRYLTEEQYGGRLQKIQPECLRIVDTQDLHFLRRAREIELKKNLNALTFKEEDVLRELASIYRSDLTLVLSSFEKNLLETEFSITKNVLMEFGFSYESEDILTPFPHCEERNGLAFIGNFRHPPNLDAVMTIKKEYWKTIREKFPNLTITFYGAYPPKEAMALHDPKNGFIMKGPVEHSIKTLSKHKILFAPIRYGSGIKGKISDAWAAGTPVLTTSIGSEGMRVAKEHQPFTGEFNEDSFAGVVADSLKSMLEAIQKILEDENFFKELQQKGFFAINQLYGEKSQFLKLQKRLEQLHSNKTNIRSQNFIQKILWREGFRSTEYFSRWIELKEKQKERET